MSHLTFSFQVPGLFHKFNVVQPEGCYVEAKGEGGLKRRCLIKAKARHASPSKGYYKRYVDGNLMADDYPSDFFDIFSAPNQLDELR